MVGAAARQQRGVTELVVADHREQRLRQVEVNVRVHAQQHVLQGRPDALAVGCRAEGNCPRPRHRLVVPGRAQRVQVEVGEGHIPALDPVGVIKYARAQRVGNCTGGSQVGGMERLPGVAGLAQLLADRRHPGDECVDAHRPSLPCRCVP